MWTCPRTAAVSSSAWAGPLQVLGPGFNGILSNGKARISRDFYHRSLIFKSMNMMSFEEAILTYPLVNLYKKTVETTFLI